MTFVFFCKPVTIIYHSVDPFLPILAAGFALGLLLGFARARGFALARARTGPGAGGPTGAAAAGAAAGGKATGTAGATGTGAPTLSCRALRQPHCTSSSDELSIISS